MNTTIIIYGVIFKSGDSWTIMVSKSIGVILVVGFLLFPLFSIHTVVAEDRWWNNHWSFRQELVLHFNTSSELAAFQPVDTTIIFDNPCWARDELNHSIRVIYQADTELESQIYDLVHSDESHITSCNLVFLTPKEIDEIGQYYVYYDESETASPMYPDHVSIEDSSYFYEPISGYPLKSQYYKISQEESITYAVAQQGQFLWYSTSQYVTKLKEGSTEMMPKNGEAAASFDFTYYYNDEMWQYNSTSQQLVSKKILCDGNLMVSCEILSRSTGDDLQTSAAYKYYYCPLEYKRIHVQVTHQALKECVIYPPSNTDGTYGSLQCGGIHSTSIQDLNFGTLYPYLHVFTEQNIVDEYRIDTNPEFIPEDPVIRLIKTTDDVDVGKNAWASFDEGTTGSVHALVFGSSSVVKSGEDERDGIQLKVYESDYPHLPGLEYDVAAFQFTRNAYEAGNATKDMVIPKGFIASFDAEFFSSPAGGYPFVETEAEIFQALVKLKPALEVSGSSGNNQTQDSYSLTVYVHNAPSVPFGSALSALTGRNFPYITVEVYREEELVSSGSAIRLPLNPLSSSEQSSFAQHLITTAHIFDARNFSVCKKIDFQQLDAGRYLIKVFRDNSLLGNQRRYIGYTIIDLTKDTKIHTFCRRQGSCLISLVDQEGNGIDGASALLMHDGVVVARNTTSNGHALLTAPCGFRQQYQLIILYHGFEVENESIRFGYVHSLISLKKSLELHQDEWSLKIMDLWELPLEIDVTPQLTSQEMETPVVLFAEPRSKDIYHFTHLVPAEYQLQIQYKSFLVEKKIQIPSNDVTLVFPAMFLITFHVLNSRGMKVSDATIQLSRGGKTVDLKSNVSGTELSVPPGSYVVSVLSQGQIISQRSLNVVSERSVDLFTTQEPAFPLLVIAVAGIIVLIGLAMSIMKKDPFYFLVVLVLGVSVAGIVSPWWALQGSSSNVQTSSVLYLIPLDLITTTKTSQFIGGELAFFPEVFTTVMMMIPILTVIICLLAILILVLNHIHKKRWQSYLMIGALILLLCSLVLFISAMSAFAEVGVGSFIGQGTLDISIPGEESVVPVLCQWGPGIGFWLYMVSVVILICTMIISVMKKREERMV
jgi:hypothetical protein